MTVTRFQQKRGTSAQWAADDIVLRDGEFGVDKDTGVIKLGDGFSPWSQLSPIMGSQYLPLLGKANDSYRLDGLSSTDFLQTSDAASFLPVGGKAADSDLLDGNDSSFFMPASAAGSFLPVAGKAADSDKLDGLDSTAFLQSADLAAYSRDRGTGNVWPSTDNRRGDVYYHTDVSALGIYNGIRWVLVRSGTVATIAARNALSWAYFGMQIVVAADGVTYEYQGATAGWTKPWVNAWGVLSDVGIGATNTVLTTSSTIYATTAALTLPLNRKIRLSAKTRYTTGSSVVGHANFFIYYDKNGVLNGPGTGGADQYAFGGSVSQADINLSRIFSTTDSTATFTATFRGWTLGDFNANVSQIQAGDEARLLFEDLGPVGPPPA